MAPLLLLLLLSLLLPPESVGESFDELLLLLESVESVVVVVLVDELSEVWSDACAATPMPTVPARLAAIRAPVSNDVRRSPLSRFICALPLR
ncbi:hypothetical protein [Paractinoplanes durhamensis]|uniref:Secreted protein n=1 Tax=Paractinoplanes durhamensis TaxID=113563 RepID=A0ABQ3YXB6_9ACTN|nr:hypothetical protein [Actinoplanes durhamensis]GIE02231.1 hypothetical protein Adu01nite_35810 [Actinoplanes durhamensis]